MEAVIYADGSRCIRVASAQVGRGSDRHAQSIIDGRAFSLAYDSLQRALFALAAVAVLAVFGKLHFYLPDNPVPITFQTAGVLLMGGFLGLRWGLLAIVVYYALGMVGAPMFASRELAWDITRGLNAVMGVTGGYLIGFITAVPIIGFMSERGWIRGKSLWTIPATGQPVDICASFDMVVDFRFWLACPG